MNSLVWLWWIMMNKKTEKYGQKRDAKGKFTKGNPGKPKGAKSKFTQDMKITFLNVFKRKGGEDWLLDWLNSSKRNETTFIQILARLLPTNVEMDAKGNITINVISKVPRPIKKKNADSNTKS